MNGKRILFVDDVSAPRFEATVVRTCEEAIDFLEDGPTDELWLNHDLIDQAHTMSLIDWIVESQPWENRPVIGVIVYFSETIDDGASVRDRLGSFYTIRYVEVTPEHFTIV